jgi:hypothetical protein
VGISQEGGRFGLSAIFACFLPLTAAVDARFFNYRLSVMGNTAACVFLKSQIFFNFN